MKRIQLDSIFSTLFIAIVFVLSAPSLAEEMAVTLLLASHDQQMVAATADRVFMFQVEKIGPTSTRSTLIEST